MSTSGPSRTGPAARLAGAAEPWLVVLVALHSYAVGAMLLLAPAWAVRFAGWAGADPLFFLRQAGVFHFVVATAYLVELARYRGVAVLVITKGFAAVFLLGFAALATAPWSVPFSGVTDGLMGVAVLAVHRFARHAAAPARA